MHTISRWLAALALVAWSGCGLAQAMYRIKPLGTLGGCTSSAPVAYGFNASDQVTGAACNANGDGHAFLWKNDGTPMVDLGPEEVGSTSTGYGINASGLVAGVVTDSTGTFGFVSSGDGAPMTRIKNTLGGDETVAYALNDVGQVTGFATLGNATETAFLWQNNGLPMIDLNGARGPYDYDCSTGNVINASGQVAGVDSLCGTPYWDGFIWKNDGTPIASTGVSPCCINASGQVAGVSGSFGAPHGYYWSSGTNAQDLGTLVPNGSGKSAATALNDAGQIAGWANTRWFGKRHAVVWQHGPTSIKDLGTLGGTISAANDINASGQVTGYANLVGDAVAHAFLWKNDGTKILDLNALIDPLDPLTSYVTLTNAVFINDASDIVADGTDSRTGLQGLYVLQGTVLTLSPRSLAFGNIKIHASSVAKSVTLTNTSSKAVVISSIALTGAAASQFASTNNCGASMLGHATCTIKVTFKPTTKGAKSATLNVNGGGGGLRTVKLTGTGT